MKKFFNALLGLVAGIVTAPLSFVLWPLALAYWMFEETED